jgi:hypothetical protein
MATLTYTLTEAITLNGQDHGGSMTNTISSIDTVVKRIVTCPDASGDDTTVLGLFGANTGADADAMDFDVDHVQYIRITNLHATSSVYIQAIGASDNFSLLLEAGKHFIMGDPESAMLGEADTTPATSGWESLAKLQIYNASGGDVQVEFLVASNSSLS